MTERTSTPPLRPLDLMQRVGNFHIYGCDATKPPYGRACTCGAWAKLRLEIVSALSESAPVGRNAVLEEAAKVAERFEPTEKAAYVNYASQEIRALKNAAPQEALDSRMGHTLPKGESTPAESAFIKEKP